MAVMVDFASVKIFIVSGGIHVDFAFATKTNLYCSTDFMQVR